MSEEFVTGLMLILAIVIGCFSAACYGSAVYGDPICGFAQCRIEVTR